MEESEEATMTVLHSTYDGAGEVAGRRIGMPYEIVHDRRIVPVTGGYLCTWCSAHGPTAEGFEHDDTCGAMRRLTEPEVIAEAVRRLPVNHGVSHSGQSAWWVDDGNLNILHQHRTLLELAKAILEDEERFPPVEPAP